MVTVDGKIYFILVSDPNSTDGDEDGIDDIVEIGETGTGPLSRDSDRDGFTDPYELANGTDPFNPDIYPIGDGRDMRTIVDPNRGIITSYPVGD